MAQRSQENSTNSATSAPMSAARKRQTVLFIILILGLISMFWEFRVAKPKHEQAWEAIQKMIATNYSKAGEVTNTNEDVEKLLGKAPAGTIPKEYQAVEIYKWRRGLPVMAYTIHVLYKKKEDGRLLLANAKRNEEFTDEDLNSTIIPPAAQPESEPAAETADAENEAEETSQEEGTEGLE